MSAEAPALSAGRVPPTVATTVVAFYDPRTGAIRFAHSVHVLAGAPQRAVDAVAEAHRAARRLGCDTAGLSVAVSDVAEHGQLPYVVDPRTGAFQSRSG